MSVKALRKHRIVVTRLIMQEASNSLLAFDCHVSYRGGIAAMTFRLPEAVPFGSVPDETIRTELQALIDTIDRAAATTQGIQLDQAIKTQSPSWRREI